MIKINEQKVVAQSQEFTFDEVHIVGGASGELKAIVSFIVNDENGKRIDTKVLEYSKEEFNTFWAGFNSGEYLYKELVAKEALEVVIPLNIEESFVNVIEEEKVLEVLMP